jgi:phosphotransferase system enzyme I (PtsI)
MTSLKGIAASNGIAIAKAYRLVEPDLSFDKKTIDNPAAEIERFRLSMEKSKSELELIRKNAEENLGADKAAIFEAHLLVLSDPELIAPIEDQITNEKVNAEAALKETADMFVKMFEQMENEYMKERAADIRDVFKLLIQA